MIYIYVYRLYRHKIAPRVAVKSRRLGDPGATAKWAPGRSAALRGLEALAGLKAEAFIGVP